MLIRSILSRPIPSRFTGRRRLRHDKRGNILMMFAFALVPITCATGMAIDYTGAMRLQTRLNAISDAAALAAVTSPMMRQPIAVACKNARATFVSQSTGMAGLTINTAQPNDLTITITDTLPDNSTFSSTCPAVGVANSATALPLSRTAAVKYRGKSLNTFAGVLGRATLDITGTASSKTTVAPYIDIHVALDTSQSMGLAATDQGMKDLYVATLRENKRGCQFGCHERDPNERYSMEDIARRNNIKMRVDVLRNATLDMIDTAAVNQGAKKLYRFGLYRIGVDFTTAANVINPITDDLATARSKVSTLTLGPNDGAVGFGDTNLSKMLDSVKPMMAPAGDGTSPAKPRSFLFIVTDGVQDLCWQSHCTSVISQAKCQQYKDAGYTVGVVYTTYLPIYENPTDPNNKNMKWEYNTFIKPLPPSTIAPALKACATPGWFFEGSDEASIHTAMLDLFRRATQTPSIIR